MQIIRSREELAAACEHARSGGRLALVPTMGALHRGHLALVEEARARAEQVIVSIFVNPLQFNDPADLERYPRDEAADIAKLEAAGCDLVWIPTPEDLFPEGFATTVSVRGVSERWEGEHRTGHFDGVATIVAKLFNAVRPDLAVFGEKDFQQLAVIRRMVRDLEFGIEIVAVAIVREENGLALSSRNDLLSPEEKMRAEYLSTALEHARLGIETGYTVEECLAVARDTIAAIGFSPIDYVALVDAETLEPVSQPAGEMRLIAAATIGTTRLIDNLPVAIPKDG